MLQPVVVDPALEALPAEDKQYLQQHAALRAVLLTMEDLHLRELPYPRQVTLMQQLHATRYACLGTVAPLFVALLPQTAYTPVDHRTMMR
jgi:hypothetical protein